MSTKLLLDEHYSETIAAQLRSGGHDVVAVVAEPQLRAHADAEIFSHAAVAGRRIVTENIKDFRPLLQRAYVAGSPVAQLLLVPPNRFHGKAGQKTTAVTSALRAWLEAADAATRPDEDWLL